MILSTMQELPIKFSTFFKSIYQDRWEAIVRALSQPEVQVSLINIESNAAIHKYSSSELSWLGGVVEKKHPERQDDDLLDVYVLDPASVMAARALNTQPGDSVLDMCAAPGGKTLVLAATLDGQGELIANEISQGRRERLIKVLQQYIPHSRRQHISVTGRDGVKFGLQMPNHFDRVLLDAPCSGERHLLENHAELSAWTQRRSENLAQRQYALLCSAYLTLKENGMVLYSTCSLSPIENDGVIRKALHKKGFECASFETPAPSQWAEKTEFGWIHLPDRSGFGPIYFSLLRKIS